MSLQYRWDFTKTRLDFAMYFRAVKRLQQGTILSHLGARILLKVDGNSGPQSKLTHDLGHISLV